MVERDERHKRMGDSRYVVEPNVKDGKGGLRDLHTLYWIGKYVHRVRSPSDLVDVGLLTVTSIENSKRRKISYGRSDAICTISLAARGPSHFRSSA
jgi:[protein-PII] uridylyltransferase